MITQRQLERQGWIVRVGHYRVTELHDPEIGFVHHLVVVPILEWALRSVFKGSLKPALPYGGKTVVELYNPATKEYRKGVAECSLKDNYNKKIGFQIAAGRALK